MTRVIGIVSGKGGVGKTTVTANLGAVLSSHFKKDVTIVDCNVTTSHLGLYLGMYYCPVTLNQVLKGDAQMENAVYEHFSGVKLVPAALSLDELKGTDIVKLRNTIKELFGKTDIILLDSAPGLGREAMATLKASDEIVYVANPYVPSIVDVIKCNQVVKDLGITTSGVVMNMIQGNRHELTKKDVEQLVSMPVVASIPYDKKILKSVNMKVPITMLEPHAKVSREFKKLAAFLVDEEYKPEGVKERLKHYLSRFKKSKKPKAHEMKDESKGISVSHPKEDPFKGESTKKLADEIAS